MATKQMQGQSTLDMIASKMRERIEKAGATWTHQRLERGIEIVLVRRADDAGKLRWRLALGRANVVPSDDEVAIFRKSFRVPEATENSTFLRLRTNPKSNTTTTWHIVEMYWYEA